MADDRAVRLALDAGRAQLRIQDLERQAAEAWDEVERLRDLVAAQRLVIEGFGSRPLAEGWDEVERLRGVVERLQVENHDLAERLMRARREH